MTSTTLSRNRNARLTPGSPARLLILGGIAFILGGMVFGDVFAVFILHQNGRRAGEALRVAAQAVAAGDPVGVHKAFASIGGLLEDSGTKVDTHVHLTDAGYLALLLALMQPYVSLGWRRKVLLAKVFILGGVMLPLGIFLIHYVGLANSPFPMIGWASILADSGGAVLLIAILGEAWGLWNYVQGERTDLGEPLPGEANSWCRRRLLGGGTLLILLGFAYGAWYAAFNLYRQEGHEIAALKQLLAPSSVELSSVLNDYGNWAAQRAVQIAAHSHLIEFGLLAILLSFIQPFLGLSERWKRSWVLMLLAGSLILPVFVLLEMKLGLTAGAIADLGGLLVILALFGMLAGVVRSPVGGIE